MNKLLLWTAICMSLSACTNWPQEGYFDNIAIHTEERIYFKQHYDYLNLHFSVANLRGAKPCVPAYVKKVENINSRVEKSISVEDLKHVKVEMAILERHITDLIVNLNNTSSNTNCAQPLHSFTSHVVHPLIYQLDLLLYCAPQFEEGNAIMTKLYKVCLRQVSFLLLDNPNIVIEYTKYKLLKDPKNKKIEALTINYNKNIVVHNAAAMIESSSEGTAVSDKSSDEDYNEIMRQYLLFDQVPSLNVQQLSRSQLIIEQQHIPTQIHEIRISNIKPNDYAEGRFTTSLDNVELLNLRTDVIFNHVSGLAANPNQNKVIYEELKFGARPPLAPVISTLIWQSKNNKDVDLKVKNWRFLLKKGELFSDAALPKGVTL
ncbi:hypothetical protein [Moritella yayanosii]|uniref:Lipoprotein n=1 Tax=Moritella yayanosii TaxID=69539 RepID=A0A330LTZ3_9GAMM|nr:hypothetical protein [Moritella yayanosii]SQD77505.1 conserved protein of unknown function [Moritella yayanosii]